MTSVEEFLKDEIVHCEHCDKPIAREAQAPTTCVLTEQVLFIGVNDYPFELTGEAQRVMAAIEAVYWCDDQCLAHWIACRL